MASSSSSYSNIKGPKGPSAVYNGLLIMIHVSTPWSEMEDGTPFLPWWKKQFGDCRLPDIVLSRLNQQCEWVTGQSSRAGVNGLMKPFSGLERSLRILPQPSGSGTVKLVVRPVCLEDNPSNLGKLESDDTKKRLWVLIDFEFDRELHVSRKDTLRSPPGSCWSTFGQPAVRALHDVREQLSNLTENILLAQSG